MRDRLRRWAWWAIALSLLPAAWLALERAGAESQTRRVAIVMDEPALRLQAHAVGLDPLDLALRYQRAGLPGIALYEDTPASLAASGRAAVALGSDVRAEAAATGDVVPDVPADATLVRELVPGATDALARKAAVPPETIELGGAAWWALPGDVTDTQPAGANRALVDAYLEAGFDLAYRPRNAPGLRNVGSDIPEEARYLIHAGLSVSGHPNALDDLVIASQDRWTALIEGTPQDGFAALRGKVPTVRLLSFNQDYLNQRLRPAEVVDKYLLAAEERNVRLLYLRPYTEEQLGDMVTNTEALVSDLVGSLRASGFEVGPLPLGDEDLAGYAPAAWARAAAAVGVVAALVLLATLYPGVWGFLAAAAVAGLAGVAAGPSWDALALIAALVFPVLGYGLLSERRGALFLATGVSLIGALLLVAVGSDRASVLGIEPFRGVAATLVIPPALYLAHALLRERGPAAWLRLLWRQEIRVGPAILVVGGLVALALVVIRRGNTPIIGASALELEVRELLSQAFARPRFKEILGHPLAMLGLSERSWPAWLRAPLLTGGVIAQASILNSFSHYHTPLAVSLERTVVALAIGLALGGIGVLIARPTVAGARRWLRNTA